MVDTHAPFFLQLLRNVRAILKNFQQWPTAAQADSQYQTFIREQFVESQDSADSEVFKARCQQAEDYALMLKNLDRQKVR
eukprot:evm.model.NODE_31868_length_15142_cov_18.426628.4